MSDVQSLCLLVITFSFWLLGFILCIVGYQNTRDKKGVFNFRIAGPVLVIYAAIMTLYLYISGKYRSHKNFTYVDDDEGKANNMRNRNVRFGIYTFQKTQNTHADI